MLSLGSTDETDKSPFRRFCRTSNMAAVEFVVASDFSGKGCRLGCKKEKGAQLSPALDVATRPKSGSERRGDDTNLFCRIKILSSTTA
jgi:hypothetical protein